MIRRRYLYCDVVMTRFDGGDLYYGSRRRAEEAVDDPVTPADEAAPRA
jgi:hypothetical protein